MYFKRILYSLLVVYSIGLQQKQVSASSLYFTAPPQGFGLSENNIGGYNAAQEKIYTCISAYTDNVLTPISGQTEFAIAFEVVSLSEAIIGITDTGAFNPDNESGSDGEKLSCSGKYETTTQMYEDTILVGASPMRVTFSLLDADVFTFKLATAETLLQKLLALTYDPAKNSKTMPVENNIAVTFNSDIIRGQGAIALKDTDGSIIESYESSDSANITITGSKLTINPSAVLDSDKNYSIDLPAGAFKDATGRNSEAVLDYGFKTQIDLAFILRGYNGTTLYETADAFASQAEWVMTSLAALSFNRITTHRVHELDTALDGGDYYQSLADIEVIDAALDNWGPISTDLDALPGKFEEHKTNNDALQNPTPEQISVLTNLRQWLVDNRKGAATGWVATTMGSQHYDAWVQPKVLNWGSSAALLFLDGLRFPTGFDPKEYKVLAIILSSQDSYNASALMSSFDHSYYQWNIQDSLGNKYTHKQSFFYDDHSGFSGQDPGYLINLNGIVDVHESIHAFAGQGGHDQDPLCIGYSLMSQCGLSA
ncbi:MAG: Ig-like domain-containing protein, partial [Dehalococcoidia bacterium]|nr:Ig-like domain-containing protein [Dehalococcoidia bacterium]